MSRYGGWLPESDLVHKAFVNDLVKRARDVTTHLPAVVKFQEAIEANPVMVSLFDSIFRQVPKETKIEHFEHFLAMLDNIVESSPKFTIAKDGDEREVSEPIGVPLYLVFDLLSNTHAAHDLFRMPEFNAALKDLLNSWSDYLRTEHSTLSLTAGKEGWFSPFALLILSSGNRGAFADTYDCDSQLDHYGFTSYDAFFSRKLKPGVRPIHCPENKSLLHNPCESTIYNIQSNVQMNDRFWLKTQSYSLYDMFGGSEFTNQFVGGTVYQAFLGPVDYHRWHAPVDGTVIKILSIPGTYYAALPDGGVESDTRGALLRSQGFLTMCSTRLLFFIEAANPEIGLLCFIAIGMAEVSTCEATVQEGDTVNTGDELGTFRFGGSTYAMVFRPEARVDFSQFVGVGQHVLVNSIIGTFGERTGDDFC